MTEDIKRLDLCTQIELQVVIVNIYKELSEATTTYFAARQELELRQQQFNFVKTTAILNGGITGKNESERDTLAMTLFDKEYNYLVAAKDAMLLADQGLQLAKINESYLTTGLRTLAMVTS